MLSDIVNDGRLIQASRNAVPVLIRRPHAYEFRRKHPESEIPGIVVLDPQGKFVGGVRIPSRDAVERLLFLLKEE